MNKQILIKVYDSSGNFVELFNDYTGVDFYKQINGGLGEINLKLARKIDDYSEGTGVNFMNKIEISVIDKDNPEGVVIYTGPIDIYETVREGYTEYVNVRATGYVAMLANMILKNSTDVTITYNSTDVQTIVQGIIDYYRAERSNPEIDYATGSVGTGETLSITMNSMFVNAALDRVVEMAGANWYWYIGADNIVYFDEKPTSATHTFVLGKDIISPWRMLKSARGVYNRVLFWNQDTLSRWYYDNTYDSTYWKRVTKISDSRITDNTYAQKLSDAFIESHLTHNHGITFGVVDNNYSEEFGYDIESINPGDTCQILNVEDSAVFSSNMTITGVRYTPEMALIEVEDLRALTSRTLTDIRRQLDKTIYDAGQPNVTEVDVS